MSVCVDVSLCDGVKVSDVLCTQFFFYKQPHFQIEPRDAI